ncbi:MAG: TfoX/Sxy family protein [Pseudolabrys sp.]
MASPVDADHIADLFSEFGPVSVRRMFGGAGIFVDGLMIGIVSDGAIFLKAGEDSVAEFEREGCGPFTYPVKGGERTIASYWRMPERLYDDPGELAQWARAALAAAQAALVRAPRRRAAVKKARPVTPKKKKQTPKPAKKPTAKSRRRRSS